MKRYRLLPKRRLSEVEKQMIFVLIEKAKIQRERSMAILNKGVLAFLAFLIIAYLSRANNLIPQIYINILFLFSVVVLAAAAGTYLSTLSKEEKILDNLLESYLK